MEQIFLLKIKDSTTLNKLLEWYIRHSQTSTYIRSEIVKEHQSGKGSRLVGMSDARLGQIVCSRPSETPEYII
jgi:hypothetical protein